MVGGLVEDLINLRDSLDLVLCEICYGEGLRSDFMRKSRKDFVRYGRALRRLRKDNPNMSKPLSNAYYWLTGLSNFNNSKRQIKNDAKILISNLWEVYPTQDTSLSQVVAQK